VRLRNWSSDSSPKYSGRGSSAVLGVVKYKQEIQLQTCRCVDCFEHIFILRKRLTGLTSEFSGVFSARNTGKKSVYVLTTFPSELNPVELMSGAVQCPKCVDMWQHAAWTDDVGCDICVWWLSVSAGDGVSSSDDEALPSVEHFTPELQELLHNLTAPTQCKWTYILFQIILIVSDLCVWGETRCTTVSSNSSVTDTISRRVHKSRPIIAEKYCFTCDILLSLEVGVDRAVVCRLVRAGVLTVSCSSV
jgi:hypothetical protein